MKRRKFGVSFEKDIVFIKYILGIMKLNIQILKKLYILKDLLEIILLKEVAQVQIHLDLVIWISLLKLVIKISGNISLVHFFYKYKDLDKIPQKLKSKLIVIDKLEFFVGIDKYSELVEIRRKLYNKK